MSYFECKLQHGLFVLQSKLTLEALPATAAPTPLRAVTSANVPASAKKEQKLAPQDDILVIAEERETLKVRLAASAERDKLTLTLAAERDAASAKLEQAREQTNEERTTWEVPC